MTLSGIDVSSNNGSIDWPAVAASGIQFAVVKATEGVRYVNLQFAADLAGMSGAGILRGVYHFALPARNSPADEAAHFIQVYKPLSQAYDVIALDLEQDPYGGTLPADCGTWALHWLAAVEAELGCKPLLYTNRALIDYANLGVVAAEDYGLWLAAPGTPAPDPAPWSVIAVQQTSWTGRVPGIMDDVDLDVFFGDIAAFRRYGIPADLPKPPLMTNDDAIEAIRRLLPTGTVDPRAARDFLTTFV